MLVSGVRSSCDASATKRRCVSIASSSAASIVLNDAPSRAISSWPPSARALSGARRRDPLRRVGQAAHRRERRARDERAAGGGRDDAAERDEDQDQAQAVQVVVQVVYLRRDDDRAGERRQQRRNDLAPVVALDHRRADVHARLLAGRRRLDRGVDRDRRAGCDLPGGADDLDVLGGLRVKAAEAEVGAVLHLGRLMADLRVDLAEEVVPHQVVDGHRRAAEHDRDDRGRDERQPEAKRHGSRRT